MDGLRISVVIPTRDRADSLRRCLREVASQIDPVLDQIVVVDDGSSDSTRGLKDEFPELTWIRLEGEGTCAARNRGVAAATGDVILFIDDDILCSSGMVERHRDFHKRHPSFEDVLVGLVTWHQDARITSHMRWLEDGGPLFAFNLIEDPDDVDPRHFCTANSSVKAEFLRRVSGPFEERIRRFTDVELALRLEKQGLRLHYEPEAIAWHLRVDDEVSTDERMFQVGRASVVLDSIHPGVAPAPMELRPSSKAKFVVARLLTPLTPVMPSLLRDRVWSMRAAWSYASGRAAAEAGE